MKRPSASASAAGARKAARTDKDKAGPPPEGVRRRKRVEKKSPIFWDSDGVDGGRSSQRVVLDWLTNPTNYAKWCSASTDRSNGNTKEALLRRILQQLEAAGITHRNVAGVREKINGLEKQYREADEFLASAESRAMDEKQRRVGVIRRCPNYYELRKVMSKATPVDAAAVAAPRAPARADRPLAVRPPPAQADGSVAVHPTPPVRPLAVHPPPARSGAVHPPPPPQPVADSAQWLKDQQAAVLRAYGEQRAIQEREHNLKEKELKMKEQELRLKEKENAREDAHAEIELALKNVQLESAQREAMVQLLLSRKKLQDNGVEQDEIDYLLPLP